MRGSMSGMSGMLVALLLALLVFAVICLMIVSRNNRKVKEMLRQFIEAGVFPVLDENDKRRYSEIEELVLALGKRLENENLTELKVKQAEYLALQNQINPHFLYNALEAIRSDALEAQMPSIAGTTKALAAYFRYTITETKGLVTLEDEIDNVESYFTVQKYRFEEKLIMKILLPEDQPELMQLKMPKLTLQPIVENAIFHGLESKMGVGTICISVDTTEQNLIVHIKDDGVGIAQEELSKMNLIFKQQESDPKLGQESETGSGIALINVNSRIKLLFGEDYGIRIFSVPDVGTDVSVFLPLV
ncbi:MAG: sensor histidine kinase [Lachnospiraceae bacterium]